MKIVFCTVILMIASSCKKKDKESVGTSGYRIIHHIENQALYKVAISGSYMVASVTHTAFSTQGTFNNGLIVADHRSAVTFRLHVAPKTNFGYASVMRTENGFLVHEGLSAFNNARMLKMNQTGTITDSAVVPVSLAARYSELSELPDGDFILCTHSYVYRFNQKLKVIWGKSFTGLPIPSNFKAMKMATDDSGNIYISGVHRTFSTLYLEFFKGTFSVIKFDKNGVFKASWSHADPNYRIVGSVVVYEGNVYTLTSVQLPNASGEMKLIVYKHDLDLNVKTTSYITSKMSSKLDAQFLHRRQNGWFIGALEVQGYEANMLIQKSFLISTDDAFKTTHTRQYGSDRNFGHSQIAVDDNRQMYLAYADIFPTSGKYGADVVLEKIDENGNIKPD